MTKKYFFFILKLTVFSLLVHIPHCAMIGDIVRAHSEVQRRELWHQYSFSSCCQPYNLTLIVALSCRFPLRPNLGFTVFFFLCLSSTLSFSYLMLLKLGPPKTNLMMHNEFNKGPHSRNFMKLQYQFRETLMK